MMLSDDDFRFIRRFPHKCCTEVSRRGEVQPCDKEAVAVAVDWGCGSCWPVCKHHTRGSVLSLADLLKGFDYVTRT